MKFKCKRSKISRRRFDLHRDELRPEARKRLENLLHES